MTGQTAVNIDIAQKMSGALIPYLAVVGKNEVASGHVNVRNRANQQTDETLDDFARRVTLEVAEKRRPDR